MATDPVSAPKDDLSRVIYGALIGLVTFIIRRYSLFTEGMMFAILIGNMFVPLLERHVAQWKTKGKAKGKKVAA
jgi:Na+-transporting NADH:ubiquinone oxidoreductase subunit B